MVPPRHFAWGLFQAVSLALAVASPLTHSREKAVANVEVQLVTDEADAVLDLLSAKRAGRAVAEEDWRRVFASEGYQRLKKREESLKRPFENSEFKSFVLSDEVATSANGLRATLERWKNADLNAAAGRALSYLPPNALIRAKIYPVIKPQTNSFVFETQTDPAIFLFIDPAQTKEQFENTVAHELHHIGYAGACEGKEGTPPNNTTTKPVRIVLDWIGAFGEGVAMLAAAGGPNIHPHQFSKPEDRLRWDRDVANTGHDLQQVQAFFLDVLDQKLKSDEEIQEKAFSFFGIQGPWYTLGWTMSVTIEGELGRPYLISSLCDPRRLLSAYNEAAARKNLRTSDALPLWSEEFLRRIGAQAPKNEAGKTP